MTNKISSGEAKARLAEMLGRVAHGGERFIIERRGKPMAALVPVGDLSGLPAEDCATDQPKGLLTLVGAWAELGDDEIDDFINDIYRSRTSDLGRTVDLES